jgi:dimethylhistidine N-methyltransferase
LAADYPHVEVAAVCADYMSAVVLPDPVRTRPRRRVGFFPGSTIGNLEPDTAADFLARWRERLRGGGMLIGVDLKKDPARLEAAYDDGAGVTAAFNLNLLNHLNRLLGADFQLREWQHLAVFNPAESRIEMHLEARCSLTVRWPGGERRFTAGERIHTENSYKWTPEGFEVLLRKAGFGHSRLWSDAQGWFGVWLAWG